MSYLVPNITLNAAAWRLIAHLRGPICLLAGVWTLGTRFLGKVRSIQPMPGPGQPWYLGGSHLETQCHLLVCDNPCSQVQPMQRDMKMMCRLDKGKLVAKERTPQKKGIEVEAGKNRVPQGKNEKQGGNSSMGTTTCGQQTLVPESQSRSSRTFWDNRQGSESICHQ